MFTGFANQGTAEYEVITPQTNLSFSVRSLTVQEEEKLKVSFVSNAKITEHLNQCLFDVITKKPKEIKDFGSFLKNLTVKDRDGLLFGLYHITYDEIRNYDITCGKCEKEYSVTIKASDTFTMEPYPSKDVLTKKVKVPLKSKGVTAVIRQPSLMDEQEAIKQLLQRPGVSMDLISETLIIESFEENIDTKVEPDIYDNRIDIIDAYKTLLSKDKRIIFDEYKKNFGQYGIKLGMTSYCDKCGNKEDVTINLVQSFFRALHEL